MRVSTAEIFEKDKNVFSKFGKDEWFRYYGALNKEVSVEKVKDSPYFLDLSENEKICYQNSLDALVEERKERPWAGYEVRYKDLD